MKEDKDYTPIVRNIQTNDLYAYKGDDVFQNIRTGVEGKLDPTIAESCLKINVEASEIINQYPIVSELIMRLNLKMEKPLVVNKTLNETL